MTDNDPSDTGPDQSELGSDEVLHAAETDALTRQPAHDPTNQREAVENALQDEGVSEAGEILGE
jgi:hypothetical protein